MKSIIKTSLIASIAALGLVACDGPAENQMEDIGEEQAEAVNERVDAMEDAGTMTDERSDAITDNMEDRADNMEEVGEAIDNNEAVVAE